jgi:hypothetical protein
MKNEALSHFKQIGTTKKSIKSYADAIISTLDDGSTNPISIAVTIAAIEKLYKELRSNESLKNKVVAMVENNGKEYDYGNFNIEICETGVKYDYSTCQHAEYDAICFQIKILEEKMKAIKEPICLPETGEIIYPPTKTSETNYKITLK